jgi:hypothetical protein
MLVTTGAIETGFRERFTRCDCRPTECDNGVALSVYQLHSYWWHGHSRESICGSNLLATSLAHATFQALRKQVGAREALRVYVGQVSETDARIVPRLELWDKLSAIP